MMQKCALVFVAGLFLVFGPQTIETSWSPNLSLNITHPHLNLTECKSFSLQDLEDSVSETRKNVPLIPDDGVEQQNSNSKLTWDDAFARTTAAAISVKRVSRRWCGCA